MNAPVRIDFAYPGDLAAPTGGYGYDRRVIAELSELGCDVRPVGLPASFPNPDAAGLAEAARLLAQVGRDALIVDGLAFGALPAELVAALAPAPIALVHHPLFLETGRPPDEAARLRASEHAALAHAAAIITTSRMTADIVAEAFGVAGARLFVAEPGVEAAARASGSTDGVVRLAAVGSLLPRKGYEDLIRALAGVAGDWRLRIAGATDHAPEHARMLRTLTQDLGLSDRITFEGAMTAAGVQALFAQADLFVTASYFEGYGMALAEAVARGLPIVATNEVAAAGAAPAQAMLTCAAGDVASLSAILSRAIGDAALREKLAESAWAAADSQPRWRDAGEAILHAVRFAMAGGAST